MSGGLRRGPLIPLLLHLPRLRLASLQAVKGHEGHHVRLSAHVYPEKDSIHVMSVKMASKGKHADKSDKAPMSEQPQQ